MNALRKIAFLVLGRIAWRVIQKRIAKAVR